jgi:hypothetical protein
MMMTITITTDITMKYICVNIVLCFYLSLNILSCHVRIPNGYSFKINLGCSSEVGGAHTSCSAAAVLTQKEILCKDAKSMIHRVPVSIEYIFE